MRGRRSAGLGAAVALGATVLAASPTSASPDLTTGTGGRPPYFSGNTTPAAARPFGLVQLGPDTSPRSASGYRAGDLAVRGFSATHLSGAGCTAFGDVPVLPWVGALPDDLASATVPFDPASERAAPGSYRVDLANGVRVRLAAGDRAGLETFRFPRGARARLLVQADGSLAGTTASHVAFPSRREVAVAVRSGGFCGSPTTYDVHVLLRFDRAVTARRTREGGAWVAFDTSVSRTVRVQVGVSFVDATGARGNLAAERLGWSATAVADAAAAQWARELGRVEATGGAQTERDLLETALYHVLLHPTTLSDADGRYPGFDGRVHRVPAGRRQYTAIPGWDAYRTSLPLLAWLRPDVASDVVGSLLRNGRQGGWLPRWPLVTGDTLVMNGDSAAPSVAAAHAFGARDVDLTGLVTRLVHQGDVPGPARPGLAAYLRDGYVPNTDPERGWAQPHGASTTLEYAIDDFAVARLAAAAGRDDVAARYLARSGSWRALLDPARRLLLPRDAAGAFPGPGYDPTSCCNGFQEGNATQYTWLVPQDMAGLLAALGSPDEVVARLDDYHAELDAGAGRGHAWLGNQPSFLTPWAYLWLGRPARTQDVVARARRELFSLGPDGLAGNDDLGSLSAWYVWASLGLFPITPGTANVGVSTPAFDRVVVRPSAGVSTTITATGTGPHVAGLVVDGRDRTASWLPFGPGSRPRSVTVVRTAEAEPAWGTGADDVPPSYPAG